MCQYSLAALTVLAGKRNVDKERPESKLMVSWSRDRFIGMAGRRGLTTWPPAQRQDSGERAGRVGGTNREAADRTVADLGFRPAPDADHSGGQTRILSSPPAVR